MPPLTASQSTTCDCRVATRRLARDSNQDTPHNSIPPVAGSPSDSLHTAAQPNFSPSPSEALLQGRTLTTHWTHLSTACPNSLHHLTSPFILRYMITALESITKKYETHLWQMVYAKTTGPGTETDPNIVPTLYPGLARGSPSVAMTGHIGIYRLEEDETQILIQEALRTSIEELGGVLSEVQKRAGLLSTDGMSRGMYSGVNGDYVGQLLGSLSDMSGNGSGLYDNSGNDTSLDGEIQMGMGMGMERDFDKEMDDGNSNEGDQEERIQVTLPTDGEMSEINMRLYQCLRRLDFLETGETGR